MTVDNRAALGRAEPDGNYDLLLAAPVSSLRMVRVPWTSTSSSIPIDGWPG